MEDFTTQTSLLQGIIDASPDAITVYQAVRNAEEAIVDMRVAMLNQQAAQTLKVSIEELVGRLMSEWNPRAFEDERFNWLKQVAETGEPFEREVHSIQPNGQSFLAWASVRRFEEYVVATFSDITERKRAEQERLEQTALLESVFASSLLGVTVFDAMRGPDGMVVDFRLRRINQAGLQMSNRTPNIIGKTLKELYPATVSRGFFADYVAVYETGTPLETDRYYPEQDRWYAISVKAISSGLVLTYQDITERKRTSQATEEQAELLRNIFDNPLTGSIVYDKVVDETGAIVDFRYRLFNKLALDMIQLSREQIEGRLVSEFDYVKSADGLFEKMVAVCETGQSMRFEQYFEGFGFWRDMALAKLRNGVVLKFNDITQRKQAEQQQQKQADLLRAIINNSPTGIVLYRAVRNAATGAIVDFTHELSNPANDAVTGRGAGALLGESVLENYPTNRENGHFDDLIQVVETGQPLRRLLDYRAHGINGWFDALYVKLDDGVLFTYLDVTESQQYRRQIEAANLELLRSNDNLQQFAYVASHDLQEPLRKIQQFGDLLINEHGALLGRNGTDYLQRMQVSAQRMSLLIKDLLAYSRLTTHREPFTPVELNSIVAEVLDDLDVSIRETGARISVGELPTIPADALQMRQLFQNLISNALKFRRTEADGTSISPEVLISCRRVHVTSMPDGLLVQFGRDKPAEQWVYEISVQDNGIGFDEKYLDRIFQVFQRLHNKGQFIGSGVGLAICRKVVENHGGAITATSRPGQGTTFGVYLPE